MWNTKEIKKILSMLKTGSSKESVIKFIEKKAYPEAVALKAKEELINVWPMEDESSILKDKKLLALKLSKNEIIKYDFTGKDYYPSFLYNHEIPVIHKLADYFKGDHNVLFQFLLAPFSNSSETCILLSILNGGIEDKKVLDYAKNYNSATFSITI